MALIFKSRRMTCVSIFTTRRSWRPPSKCAFRNASTIFLAASGAVLLAPRQSTLASLCCRAMEAECSSLTSAANAGNFVRRNAHADAAGANQNAQFRLVVRHALADQLREVRVIIRRLF